MIQLTQLRHSLNHHFSLEIDHLHLRKGLNLIVGHNGAGKTTLLRLLATVNAPEQGVIQYQEGTIVNQLPQIRSQIGFVPSEVELIPAWTPRRLLTYLACLKGVNHPAEIDRLLQEFHLQEVQHSKLGSLSWGTQQKVAICQAMLGSPRYLFLDEPLNFLDSIERRHIIHLLQRYAQKHLVVVVTHDLNEWDEPDWILHLCEGRVLFSGSCQQWLSLLPMRIWEGSFSALLNEDQLSNEIIFSCRKEADEFQYVVFSSDPPFPDFKPIQPTIEHAYMLREKLNKIDLAK